MHQTQKVDSKLDILLDQLTQKISFSYLLAEQFFNRSLIRPSIRLDLRGQSAGSANPTTHLLRFNKVLFLANHQHFLTQTVPHEVAHLVAYEVFGSTIKPHGKEWQHIMHSVYQLPAERCHHYQLTKKAKRYFLYACQCKKLLHPLSARRHHLIAQGYQYICKHCKETLKFTGKIEYQ